MPGNVTLLHLPPYAPELNPVENVRAYLRSSKLSNRVLGLAAGKWRVPDEAEGTR